LKGNFDYSNLGSTDKHQYHIINPSLRSRMMLHANVVDKPEVPVMWLMPLRWLQSKLITLVKMVADTYRGSYYILEADIGTEP